MQNRKVVWNNDDYVVYFDANAFELFYPLIDRDQPQPGLTEEQQGEIAPSIAALIKHNFPTVKSVYVSRVSQLPNGKFYFLLQQDRHDKNEFYSVALSGANARSADAGFVSSITEQEFSAVTNGFRAAEQKIAGYVAALQNQIQQRQNVLEEIRRGGQIVLATPAFPQAAEITEDEIEAADRDTKKAIADFRHKKKIFLWVVYAAIAKEFNKAMEDSQGKADERTRVLNEFTRKYADIFPIGSDQFGKMSIGFADFCAQFDKVRFDGLARQLIGQASQSDSSPSPSGSPSSWLGTSVSMFKAVYSASANVAYAPIGWWRGGQGQAPRDLRKTHEPLFANMQVLAQENNIAPDDFVIDVKSRVIVWGKDVIDADEREVDAVSKLANSEFGHSKAVADSRGGSAGVVEHDPKVAPVGVISLGARKKKKQKVKTNDASPFSYSPSSYEGDRNALSGSSDDGIVSSTPSESSGSPDSGMPSALDAWLASDVNLTAPVSSQIDEPPPAASPSLPVSEPAPAPASEPVAMPKSPRAGFFQRHGIATLGGIVGTCMGAVFGLLAGLVVAGLTFGVGSSLVPMFIAGGAAIGGALGGLNGIAWGGVADAAADKRLADRVAAMDQQVKLLINKSATSALSAQVKSAWLKEINKLGGDVAGTALADRVSALQANVASLHVNDDPVVGTTARVMNGIAADVSPSSTSSLQDENAPPKREPYAEKVKAAQNLWKQQFAGIDNMENVQHVVNAHYEHNQMPHVELVQVQARLLQLFAANAELPQKYKSQLANNVADDIRLFTQVLSDLNGAKKDVPVRLLDNKSPSPRKF